MDAPSRGSCTQKIPRTLANGELTMYSYAIDVSSIDRGRFLAMIWTPRKLVTKSRFRTFVSLQQSLPAQN